MDVAAGNEARAATCVHRSIVVDALRCLGLGVHGVVTGLVLCLLLAVLPGLLSAALCMALDLSGDWLHTAIRATRAGLVVSQVVLVVMVFSGLLRAFLTAARSGRPIRHTTVLTCGRESWWLLGVAGVSWLLVWQIADGGLDPHESTLPTALVVLMLAAAALAVPLLAALTQVAPLVVERRLRTLSAIAESLRLAVRVARLKHFIAGALAAAATLAAFTLPVAVPTAVEEESFYEWPLSATPLWTLRTQYPWSRALLVGAAIWLVLMLAATLTAAVYRQVCRQAAADGAESHRAREPRGRTRRATAIAVVAIVAAAASVTLAWSIGRNASTQAVAPGERVSLANGLSFVAPPGAPIDVTTYRRYPAWLPFGENTLATPVFVNGIDDPRDLIGGCADSVFWDALPEAGADLVALESFYSEHAFLLRRVESNPVVAESADGAVVVHAWAPYSRWLQVLIRLPGRPIGVVTIVVERKMADERAVVARRVWRLLDIRGASLPDSFSD